jgi:hypothetical protein
MTILGPNLTGLRDTQVMGSISYILVTRVHDQRGGEHLADVLRKIIKIEGDLNCLLYVYIIVVARDIMD